MENEATKLNETTKINKDNNELITQTTVDRTLLAKKFNTFLGSRALVTHFKSQCNLLVWLDCLYINNKSC